MHVMQSYRAKLNECFDVVSKQLLSATCVRFSVALKNVAICLDPPKKQNCLQLVVFWGKTRRETRINQQIRLQIAAPACK